MANRASQKDLLDQVSGYLAHNKGLPVFVGVGLILVSLILNCFPALADRDGLLLLSWFVRSDFLFHLGAIIGLVGILLGDAL